MIRFENVSKTYQNDTIVLDSLSLSIDKGEFFVLIGPSGCGKTTTLKLINQLIIPSSGEIYINEKAINVYDIHELRWNIGYVLQQVALFPHLTIEENIAVVPRLLGWKKEKIRARVDELLAMVNLEPNEYRDRKPSELSGGQGQRVGVLRALAANPEILLMDEPFSALDPISRQHLQEDLLNIQRTIQKTIVFVTHDMDEARKLGDRIAIMDKGKVVQCGTAAELQTNGTDKFVQQFFSKESILQLCAEQMMEALAESCAVDQTAKVVDHLQTYEELVHLLTNEQVVYVEKEGEIIGQVTAQTMMKNTSQELKGKRYE